MLRRPLITICVGIWFLLGLHTFLASGFHTDEFTYSHAAWLISQGEVPYRDFPLLHVPFMSQLLAPLLLMLDVQPASIQVLRLATFALFIITALSGFLIARKLCGKWALLLPVAMLVVVWFSSQAVQIRPDTLAFSIFMVALSAVFSDTPRIFLKGYVIGVLICLAGWSSEKALLYAAPLVVFGLLSVVSFRFDFAKMRWSRGDDTNIRLGVYGSPWGLVLGIFTGLLSIGCYLWVSSSFGGFYHYAVEWAVLHEEYYPPRYYWPRLRYIINTSWWLCLLCLVGIFGVGSSLLKKDSGRISRDLELKELLLLAIFVSTFLSYVIQRAPFNYSLMPFTFFVLFYAIRGFAWLWGFSGKRKVMKSALVVLLACGFLSELRQARSAGNNSLQMDSLRRLGRLTSASDCIYDNIGKGLGRPHADWWMFTDALMRRNLSERLVLEVPPAILKRGCPVMIKDQRFDDLPEQLKQWLLSHFRPHVGEIWLWGQSFVAAKGTPFEAAFTAIKDGYYKVRPPELAHRGALSIDGTTIKAPTFFLRQGEHRIELSTSQMPFEIFWHPPLTAASKVRL